MPSPGDGGGTGSPVSGAAVVVVSGGAVVGGGGAVVVVGRRVVVVTPGAKVVVVVDVGGTSVVVVVVVRVAVVVVVVGGGWWSGGGGRVVVVGELVVVVVVGGWVVVDRWLGCGGRFDGLAEGDDQAAVVCGRVVGEPHVVARRIAHDHLDCDTLVGSDGAAHRPEREHLFLPVAVTPWIDVVLFVAMSSQLLPPPLQTIRYTVIEPLPVGIRAPRSTSEGGLHR